MKRILVTLALMATAAVSFGELSGIGYQRAINCQVNTNDLSYVYSNLISSAGVTGLLSLQTMLELFWLGGTSYFENVDIAGDLVVDDDASIGGDLTVAGSFTVPTGTISSLTVGTLTLTSSQFSQLAYLYANTGTFTVASGTSGASTFTAATQSVGMLHAGMAITGSIFQAGTTISAVNYTSRVVTVSATLSGSGTGTSCSFWGGGTYTHTVPSGFSRSKVTVVGGGGGGGDRAGTDSGGGGGGACIGYWNLVAGTAYTVTVGAGGAGAAGAGTNGSSSSFGSLQTATGGNGASAAGGNGALGGFGTGGLINFYGGRGESAGGDSFFGGGGTTITNFFNGRHYGGGGGGNGGGVGGHGHFGCVLVEYY